MSKLPEADELPRAEEGYDPARVEEAFAEFSERVRELESVAGELRDELRSLRAERASHAPLGPEAWPDEHVPSLSPDWVAAVPSPLVRPLTVPRVALEGVFLLLVALFAGLADLPPVWIVVVMVAAWALVALAEWSAAATRARWRLDEIPPDAAVHHAFDETGPWDMPVVGATAIATLPESEGKTVVTKLPEEDAVPGPGEAEDDAEPVGEAPAEEQPARRRFSLRRRKAEETGPADPWEA